MSNQPTPPYGVPPQSRSNAYNPITWEDVQPPDNDPFFRSLDNPAGRIVVGALFVMIFLLSSRPEVATPLVLLVLLACLFYRMTARQRAIAAAPLTFSAVRLAAEFAGPLGIWRYATPMAPGALGRAFEASPAWVPLFLAVHLFFSPTRLSKSHRVVFWYSVTLLLSGLLPGNGYTYICAILFYTLFFAMVITLTIDLSENSYAPRPMPQSPQPARA